MNRNSNFISVRTYAKVVLLIVLLAITGWMCNSGLQQSKARIKLGAYYFGGWAGTNRYDDGTPENAWAKGMPLSVSKKLVTEFSGRMPLWGWRDDTQEIMERQIDLAADNGLAYFSFCWYWADNKGPINIEAIESDPKHEGIEIAGSRIGTLEEGYTLRANYGIVPGWGQNPEKHPYTEVIKESLAQWHGTPEQRYIPSITVGCDTRPRGTKAWYFDGNTPEAFGDFLELMIKWMDEHPDQVTKDRLAVVYAWNEIDEGAMLIPCKDDPHGAYLKVIRNTAIIK